VELVARDPVRNDLNFYLVSFEQACNASANGCSPADLLTPAVESSWTGVTVYADVDLKNTILDCLHCHQPAATGPKMLRMQELRDPWTHWFRDDRPSNVLLADYRAAHPPDEVFAGMPGPMVDSSDPSDLEDLLRAEGYATQPNEFPTAAIEAEGIEGAAWQAIFANVLSGAQIPVPFSGIRAADAAKLTAAAASYKAVVTGAAAPSTLIDFRDIFTEQAMLGMSLKARPGLNANQILVQMCQRCHNPSLDRTISRARFDTTALATMTRAEKDIAIERLLLPATSKRRMPPERFGSLTAAEIQLVVTELKK
jgi:hypothetical protein